MNFILSLFFSFKHEIYFVSLQWHCGRDFQIFSNRSGGQRLHVDVESVWKVWFDTDWVWNLTKCLIVVMVDCCQSLGIRMRLALCCGWSMNICVDRSPQKRLKLISLTPIKLETSCKLFCMKQKQQFGMSAMMSEWIVLECNLMKSMDLRDWLNDDLFSMMI